MMNYGVKKLKQCRIVGPTSLDLHNSVVSSTLHRFRRRWCAALVAALLCLGSVARAAPFVVPNPYAASTSADILIPRLIVFGDSYSSVNTVVGYWKWSTQLYFDTHQAVALDDIAVGGSTGGNYGSPTNDTFSAQVSRFLSNHTARDGDLTFVYFGYNDMTRSVIQKNFPGIPKILRDFTAALNRLVAAGFARGNRRLVVIEPHDWSRVPRFTGPDKALAPAVHNNIQAWNAGIARLAIGNPNVMVIDLYTAMECVFKQPKPFGFTNVTNELTNRKLAEQFLYNYKDRYHFGAHGHRLIRQVIEYYLTKGWDWANTTKDPVAAKKKFVAELRAGNVFPVKCTSLSASAS